MCFGFVLWKLESLCPYLKNIGASYLLAKAGEAFDLGSVVSANLHIIFVLFIRSPFINKPS